MNRFTKAYDTARNSVKSYKFAKNWKSVLDGTACLQCVLHTDGPNRTRGANLDVLRKKIAEKKNAGTSEGATILSMIGVSKWGIIGMSSNQSNAAATLKMMRHLYLVKDAGAQTVWIYAGPYSFHKWVFDELKGKNGWSAEGKLNKVDEVYTKVIRKHMGTGVTTSLAWCQKAVAKLGSPNQATKAMVETWFAPGGTGLNGAITTLKDGFKKVSILLSSSKLIFSDEPIDRMKGSAVTGQSNYASNWNDYAFVDGGVRERLDVVYIQNATLKKWGSSDEGWMATLAIIHELTHRVLETADVVYDFTGLKPNDKLTCEHALKNADSWAYFAADINGALTDDARNKYYKSPAALRQRYLDSLSS